MKTYRLIPNFSFTAKDPVNVPKNWVSLDPSTSVDIQAAEDGDEAAPSSFFLNANTGRPMFVNGFLDPVVIDLAGAKFDQKRTPVIADHDTAKRIGHTTEQAIIPAGGQAQVGGRQVKGPLVAAVGQVSSTMGIAQGFVKDARSGFPFQVSVGATTLKAFYVEEGETVEVNGRTWKGPLVVASQSVIRELSVVVLGADSRTQATITASHRKESSPMNFEAFVRSLHLDPENLTDPQRKALKAQWKAQHAPTDPPSDPPADPPTDPDLRAGGRRGGNPNPPTNPPTDPNQDFLAERRRLQASEDRRVSAIQATSRRFQEVREVTVEGRDQPMSLVDFQAHAIESGMDADQFELQLRRAELPTPSGGPAIHSAPQLRDMDNSVLSCAILKGTRGVPMNASHEVTGERWGVENWYPEQVLEASDHRQLRHVSLHQLMDLVIIAAQGHGFSGNRKSDDFIQATRQAQMKIQAAGGSGFDSLNLTNIFEDSANKILLASYQSAATTWQEWSGVQDVSDFNTHNLYRLTTKGAYEPVGADGELKHGGWDEDKYTIAADTYGKIVGLTRKHLINDDLGAFRRIMTALGIEGAKTVEELAYIELLDNLTTLFPTGGGNNNYISGASTVMSVDGLSEASKTFENQVDSDNAPLLIEPDRVLVGTQDRVDAAQLFKDADIREGRGGTSTKKEFTKNPHVGAFRPIVSGYLNNTSIKRRVTSQGNAIPGQSSTQWFMFSDPNAPQGAVVNVAFLNGNRLPILENSDAAFNVLGLQWRAFHDVGTGQGDPKLGVMSKGAA